MKYKKGQIVPKFLVEKCHRKLRHQVKFGCDVTIIGKTVISTSAGTVFCVNNIKKIGKKGRPNINMDIAFKGINVFAADQVLRLYLTKT